VSLMRLARAADQAAASIRRVGGTLKPSRTRSATRGSLDEDIRRGRASATLKTLRRRVPGGGR